MKKQMKTIGFAALCAFFVVGGASAATKGFDPCPLIKEFKGIFSTLRTLAFVGAAWIIFTWAWKFISEPKEVELMKEVKEKGISMIVGFVLLFSIGTILQLLTSATGAEVLGCALGEW